MAARLAGLPAGQPIAAKDGPLESHLAALGSYSFEPVSVAPFRASHDGVDFGFIARDEEGVAVVDLQPGFVIAYYEPWDGVEYDT